MSTSEPRHRPRRPSDEAMRESVARPKSLLTLGRCPVRAPVVYRPSGPMAPASACATLDAAKSGADMR
eukprot:2988761-Prymnesium_polylepis.1